jgi:hypothetical protein
MIQVEPVNPVALAMLGASIAYFTCTVISIYWRRYKAVHSSLVKELDQILANMPPLASGTVTKASIVPGSVTKVSLSIINDEFDLSNDVRTGLEWALAPARGIAPRG